MTGFTRIALALAVCSLCVAGAAGQEQPAKPKVKIEFLWAELKPIKGLTEDKGIQLTCREELSYLHKKAILDNQDVAETRLTKFNLGTGEQYMIDLQLTREAKMKLALAGDENLKKPLVIVIDGAVRGAMVLDKSRLADFVPFAGAFSKTEAEKIIMGIK